MNVAATGTHASLPESKIDLSPPKKANAASFHTVNSAEIHDITYERECLGVANELDMDAFFAAWGSDDADYDVDGNGIVDGGDLTILLSAQTDTPTPGTVDDVLQQWGTEGESSADLNNDGMVDGEDLVLALAGPATPPPPQEPSEDSYESKLESLLADWGTDAERSDLNNDGIVDGLDLSELLSQYSDENNEQRSFAVPGAVELPRFTDGAPAAIIDPASSLRMAQSMADTRELGGRIFSQLQEMGFSTHPPRNLTSLVDAFKLGPTDSRTLLSNITDLFGGKDGKDIARG